jgi:hypothetical protein
MNKLAVSVEDIKVSVEDIKRKLLYSSSPPPSPRAGCTGGAPWKHSGCLKLNPRDATAHELGHAKAQNKIKNSHKHSLQCFSTVNVPGHRLVRVGAKGYQCVPNVFLMCS